MKYKIQRHERVIALLQECRFMSVEQLAETLGVTPQTIRRDIHVLENAGRLKRYHGGASVDRAADEMPQNRNPQYHHEKKAIAQLICDHIPDNASLFISIGTTMEAVAAELVRRRKNLKIITNNIHVASLTSARKDYCVIITSGVVRPLDGGITGVATVDFINQFKVDYAVMSTHGVENDGSLLDYDYKEVSVMHAMMANARVCFLGVDHSKFQSHALVRLGNISDFDKVFTDRPVAEEMQNILANAGVECLVPKD